MMNSQIDTVVLSGGSFKGYSYIGVFKRLEELGICSQIKKIAACSVGTIFALLFQLGYNYEKMIELAISIDTRTIYNFDIRCFLTDFGFCDFSKIKDILSKILIENDLSSECTFQQLYDRTKIHFIVNATCLNTQSTEYFHHLVNPDMQVLTAIQMSTAVPFIFVRVKHNDKFYIDGGILDNLPMTFFEKKNSTLAICLVETPRRIDTPIENISQYLNLLINCVFNRYNMIREKLYYPNSYIIKISANVNLFNSQLGKEDILQLVTTGYNQTRYYLVLWSEKQGLKSKNKITIKLKFKKAIC